MLSPTQTRFSGSYAFFRLDPSRREEALAAVRDAWERVNPDWPFEAYALDRDIRTLFTAERRTARILQIASITAIVICALGLLGLAAFLTRQRTREIGIRKVLGASLGEITLLVSREYALCILAANFIAWPAAWWLLDRWLMGFAYRIPLRPGPFLLAAAASAALTFGVMLAQAWRVARTDPARVLRYE
jgi:putative ABC transport system permease protein